MLAKLFVEVRHRRCGPSPIHPPDSVSEGVHRTSHHRSELVLGGVYEEFVVLLVLSLIGKRDRPIWEDWLRRRDQFRKNLRSVLLCHQTGLSENFSSKL